MKTIRRISFLLIAAFILNSRVASGDLVKITGTVVDAKGKPVADAQVDCDYYFVRRVMALPDVQSRQHTTTDSAGAYKLSIPRGALTIVARKAGLAAGWKTLQFIPNGPIEALTLGTPSFLSGVVVDEKGHPVAGAEVSVSVAADRKQAGFGVQQSNFIFGKTAGELFSTRTSADGRFRIEGFPAGAQANLAVKASGRALRPVAMAMNGFEMQAQAGDKDIKLVTDPAANIEGKVVVRDKGAPLAGAELQWIPANPRNGFSMSEPIQSGADGSFRISDIPGGSYRLTAIFTNEPIPLWVADNVPVTVAAGETAHDIKIQASKGGVVQVVVVSKGDHKGVPEVNVSANNEDYNTGVTTGDDGVAYLRLPPGEFNLFAMKQGMSQVQEQTTVTDGETNRVTLEMDLPAKISGVVRDASGSPVANTSVGVFPDYTGGAEVMTDVAGHYEVAWQKPAWAGMQNQTFYMVARNAEHNLAAIHEIDEKTRSLDLDLKPASSVSGRAQDTKGNTITNTTGFVLLQTDNMGFMISRQQVSADEQGKIEMEALPGGQRYTLSVFAEGYGSGSQTMVTPVTNGGHYDFAPVVLKLADRKLAGRVLGTDGKPVSGANVFINGEGQPNGNAMTDADGRFAFDAVCEGNINISANSQGHSGSINATGGETNVVVRFDVNQLMYSRMGSLQVSGTVYD